MHAFDVRLSRHLIMLLAAFLPALALAALPPPPPRSEKGAYQGTWYFVDRHAKLAFWFVETEKGLKVRYRYQAGSGYGDSGETGTGPSNSSVGPGTFSLTYRLGEDDVVRGHMVRRWSRPDLEVSESNDFEAYRIFPGDRIYCRFTNGLLERTENGQSSSEPMDDYYFTFVQATDEIVLWEELPF
jgi:hypothetical protein